MTGYGKAEYNNDGINLVIEIKTINGKYLDLSVKSPKILMPYEDLIRKSIQNKIGRGRVDVFVTFNDLREKDYGISVDTKLAKAYFDASNKIADGLNLANDLTVAQIVRLPDVVTITNNDDDIEVFNGIIKETVDIAVDNLVKMRKVEGEKLKADLISKLDNIVKYVQNIEEIAPLVAEDYAEGLKARIKDALENVAFDESKFLNEVAFFVDKSNIDEELTRLKSHIKQFTDIANSDLGGEGKKLDFLLQEFNRESNTIGSKANNIKITKTVLLLKNEIEKIREQVQNVE